MQKKSRDSELAEAGIHGAPDALTNIAFTLRRE